MQRRQWAKLGMTQRDDVMKKVLFVCTGNTCRSPMAQGLCNKIAKNLNLDIEAQSAGVATISGLPVSENAKAVCREYGVDISNYRTKYIEDIDLSQFDRIYVMSNSHKDALIYKGADKNKITVLAEGKGGISDPYGGDLEVYRKCRDELYSAIENSVKEL